jgi:lysophospholipase L1-like esterase
MLSMKSLKNMIGLSLACAACWGLATPVWGAETTEAKKSTSILAETVAELKPEKAPEPPGLLLKQGDRLAICGDSITEQKMYSRIMETYLTVAVPDLGVTVRQYGWSGETAPGFLGRMKNDCLRFNPTVATTCYGMNDHGYRPYDDSIGKRYREASLGIVKMFKDAGVRVVQGSPGCIGKKPGWSQSQEATVKNMNLNLCALRNIGIEIARSEQVAFADVFMPMIGAGVEAFKKYGDDFAVAGKDGVHPDWAGQLIMASAFLKGLGLDGEIGTFTVDLKSGEASVSRGHELKSCKNGRIEIKSSRYPFCAPETDPSKDNNIRAGMALAPFNRDLNRLLLTVKNGTANHYQITWGGEKKSYSADRLAKGVNLAREFSKNPFCEAFANVDKAVAAKQNYETRQIKELFHGPEGKADMEATATLTEKAREPLADAIRRAFVPVEHAIVIEAQ